MSVVHHNEHHLHMNEATRQALIVIAFFAAIAMMTFLMFG